MNSHEFYLLLGADRRFYLFQTVFEGFGELIFVKEWYERCLSRPASKKSMDVCPFLFPTN